MKTMYVARNKGGVGLYAFSAKPVRKGAGWDSQGAKWIPLPSSWCSNVTFDNSPQRIRGLVPARN